MSRWTEKTQTIIRRKLVGFSGDVQFATFFYLICVKLHTVFYYFPGGFMAVVRVFSCEFFAFGLHSFWQFIPFSLMWHAGLSISLICSNISNTTGSGWSAFPSKHPRSPPVYGGVRVGQSGDFLCCFLCTNNCLSVFFYPWRCQFIFDWWDWPFSSIFRPSDKHLIRFFVWKQLMKQYTTSISKKTNLCIFKTVMFSRQNFLRIKNKYCLNILVHTIW